MRQMLLELAADYDKIAKRAEDKLRYSIARRDPVLISTAHINVILQSSLECEPVHSDLPEIVIRNLVSHDWERPHRMEDEMNELIFGGDLAENVYVSLILFLLLYVAGFVLLRRWSRTFGASEIPWHVISGFGAALVTMTVGFGLHSANVTMASVRGQSGATTSIEPLELQRAIAEPLPVQKLEDQTLVFTTGD